MTNTPWLKEPRLNEPYPLRSKYDGALFYHEGTEEIATAKAVRCEDEILGRYELEDGTIASWDVFRQGWRV